MMIKRMVVILPCVLLFSMSMQCFARIPARVTVLPQKQVDATSTLSKSSKLAKFKAALKIGSGVAAALAAHIVSEFAIVTVHECGHVLGGRLTGGSGGSISVYRSQNEGLIGALLPFQGVAYYSGGNDIVSLATGPITGLATTACFIAASEGVRTAVNGKSMAQGAQEGFKKPVTIYKQISDYVARILTNKKHCAVPSFASTFFATFALLKSSRMVGEFLYGLTPVSINVKTSGGIESEGDGARIWRNFGVKQDMTVSSLKLLGLAVTPACLAALHGIYKAYATRNKEELPDKRKIAHV